MDIPEEPPDVAKIIATNPSDFLIKLRDEELQKFLREELKTYNYWSKFKYLPMPAGINPEIAWAAREFKAMTFRKVIPLNSLNEKQFSYWIPDWAQETLHHIDRKNPAQLASSGDLPSAVTRDRFIASSLMEEAIASSQIEGAATTRKVAKEMLRSGRQPRDKSEKMILNNYRAMEKLRKLKDFPLTIEVLHELHTTLTQDTLDDPNSAGRFRQSPSDDDVRVLDGAGTGNIIHSPPLGSELPGRIAKFLDFANDAGSDEYIHPVVKAILLHFWIGYDHPYVDGNGRAARAVFYWYLLRRGYWLFEFISLSRIVLKDSRKYYDSFMYSERQNCDATYFVLFNLRSIDTAIDEVQHYIAAKQKEMAESTRLLHGVKGLNLRQKQLLLNALKSPGRVYTVYGHQQAHGVSYQTANHDLQDLMRKRLLSRQNSGRTYLFTASERLTQLLQDIRVAKETPEPPDALPF